MTRRLPTYSDEKLAEAVRFARQFHMPGPVLIEDAAAEWLIGGQGDDVALEHARKAVAEFLARAAVEGAA